MFSLSVRGDANPDHVYWVELMTQCSLAEHAYSRLAEYARCQIDRDWDATADRPKTPIEVIADCTVFLSAAAAIAKLLYPSATKSQTRASDLRSKLAVTQLPNLSSTIVRNSFEHIDERLDKVIKNHEGEDICQIHVARDEPCKAVVLKRFDPVSMSIQFLGDILDLSACNTEVVELEKQLAARLTSKNENHP